MADRTAAGAFGKIFRALSENPENKNKALKLLEYTRHFNFTIDQMEATEALINLGVAKPVYGMTEKEVQMWYLHDMDFTNIDAVNERSNDGYIIIENFHLGDRSKIEIANSIPISGQDDKNNKWLKWAILLFCTYREQERLNEYFEFKGLPIHTNPLPALPF